MGSPLGPTLANIFMSAPETRYLDECPPEFKPVLYRRYVDDTFCLFKDLGHVDSFFNMLTVSIPISNLQLKLKKIVLCHSLMCLY